MKSYKRNPDQAKVRAALIEWGRKYIIQKGEEERQAEAAENLKRYARTLAIREAMFLLKATGAAVAGVFTYHALRYLL